MKPGSSFVQFLMVAINVEPHHPIQEPDFTCVYQDGAHDCWPDLEVPEAPTNEWHTVTCPLAHDADARTALFSLYLLSV